MIFFLSSPNDSFRPNMEIRIAEWSGVRDEEGKKNENNIRDFLFL
jgi:hypothetical protein